MNKNILIIVFLVLCMQLSAQEFAYVTYSLLLRVYSSPSGDGEALQTIESGDSVEVLEKQNGFSRVITNDGTQGWVKSAFLVQEPPAKLLYYSVSQQNEELKSEIANLQNSTTNSADNYNDADRQKIADLESELVKQQELNQTLHDQLADIENDQTKQSTKTSVVPQASIISLFSVENKKWLLIGIPIGLILVGLLLGLKISSWRLRKRLHGFRF